MRIGIPVVDSFAGMNAAIGVLAALESRSRTGQGQRVDISLFESAVASLLNAASSWLNAGVNLGRTGNDHPSAAPYGVFEASDGYMIIATFNDREFERMANVLGHPEWLEDERFRRNSDRVRNREALKAAVNAVISQRTRAEWVEILNSGTVSAGPINEMADLEKDEHAAARGLFVSLESPRGTVRTVASPFRLSATPPDYRLPPPAVGEHTAEILEELGYSDREREALYAAGVL
jgi:crotonobetainyl-CoA:carnitine CoA-transferase CaiB-like acyl-CoA transferase